MISYYNKRVYMVININKQNIEQELLKAKLPAVLKVYASWCGPCQQLAPLYDELSKELVGKYILAQMNVDDARDLSIEYGVTSIPTFVFFKDGKVVGKEVGYMSKDELLEAIENHLK